MTTPTIAGQRRGVWNARLRAALPTHLDRLTWDADRVRDHQRDRLRALLRHAEAHSRFHAERLAGIDPARFELADLPSLPTMTKAEMMASTTCSPTRGCRARPWNATYFSRPHRGHAAARRVRGARLRRQLRRAGRVRLRVRRDRRPHPRADPRRARPAARPRAAAPGGVPMAMVAAASPIHATRALPELFSGELLAVTSIPVTLPLPEIVERLNRARPMLLQGYPSVLSLLATERAAGRLRIAPLAVTGSSEQFLPDARARPRRRRLRRRRGRPVRLHRGGGRRQRH
jgi:hypothetical protein